VLKWRQNVLCEIQDGVPLKLKNNVQHPNTRAIPCLDVASTHSPSTRSIFFQSQHSYRPAEGRVEAKCRQRPGPPPATTNRLLAEPGGGPWANYSWVEVSRGRFVGGRIVKAPSNTCRLIPISTYLSFRWTKMN
jgi:hypothetical protein